MSAARTLSFGFLIVALAGCHNTFRSVRIYDDTKFAGVPALVHRAHLATIMWSQKAQDGNNMVTKHLCRLPVLYGIDVQPSLLGKTKATFGMNDDGQLTKAQAELDHQIDELFASAADVLGELPPLVSRAGPREGYNFQPELPNNLGHIVSIEFQEVN